MATLMEELETMRALNSLNQTTNKIMQMDLAQINSLLCQREIDRLLALPEYQNAKRLEAFGRKVYSQNDEDGIIHEIFERIGSTNKRFVEFGVEGGLECNTHFLLFQGWQGLWLEGSQERYAEICRTFQSALLHSRLRAQNVFVNKENINALLREFQGEIDLLSIDIDGNDYHIFEAVSVISPRVVVIEYNAKFPPYINWVMKYDAAHLWDGSDKCGASLKALELLGGKKGYQLVGTNLTGVNAFFVRKDLAAGLFFEPADAEHLYNPARQISFSGGHSAKHFLADF